MLLLRLHFHSRERSASTFEKRNKKKLA